MSGHTPQEVGSAITYARRYLFGCLTGIVTDEDDDGAQAQSAARRAPRPQKVDPRTDLVNRIAHGLDQAGVRAGNAKLVWLSEQVGREVGSPWELTDDEMRHVLTDLEGEPA